MHKAVLRYICLAAQGTDTKATCPVIKTKQYYINNFTENETKETFCFSMLEYDARVQERTAYTLQ